MKQLVAVKIGIADSLPHEIKILRKLDTRSAKHADTPVTICPLYIPRILDEFELKGPNGSHPCYTTVPALCNLRQSSFSRLFRPDVARALVYELCLAVAFVHSRGVVHGGLLLYS